MEKDMLFLFDRSQGVTQLLLLSKDDGLIRAPLIEKGFENRCLFLQAVFGVETNRLQRSSFLQLAVENASDRHYYALDVTTIPLTLQDGSGIMLTSWKTKEEVQHLIPNVRLFTVIELAFQRVEEQHLEQK